MNQVPPPLLPGSRPGSSSFAAASPIKRAFAAIVGVVLFAAAATVGFMLFLALLAIGAMAALVLGARLWWWRRRFAQATAMGSGRSGHQSPGNHRGDVFEGEYRVVDRTRD